jgi:GT2 family glycosyltransferase
MSLSVIIVNYKSTHLILDCLATIFQQPGNSNIEIIVVDNDSNDGGKELITSRYPQVKWLQLDYNAGFARGNNAGIRISRGEVVLLLNPDTLVENNSIKYCWNRLIASSYVAAGVQLLNPDRTPQITGNFFMKGGLNHLMALPYTGTFIRRIGLQLKIKKTNIANVDDHADVDWINGAFLMVKKSAIEKAGYLDEDFFLYSEEIEWCGRLRKFGSLCVYGDLHVIHLQGESAKDAFGTTAKGYQDLSDKKGYQIMLSGLVRIRKQFGVGWFLLHLTLHLFTIPVYLIIILFKNLLFLPGSTKEWKLWWGFSVNVLKVCSYLFTIIRNKPHFYKVL